LCRAQTSIEFVVLTGFTLLTFLAFFVVVQSNTLSTTTAFEQNRLRQVQHLVTSEVDLAAQATAGYSRTFQIPDSIDGNNYSIILYDGQELVLNMAGQEIVTFLDWNVTGNLSKGNNLITKPFDNITMTPLP